VFPAEAGLFIFVSPEENAGFFPGEKSPCFGGGEHEVADFAVDELFGPFGEGGEVGAIELIAYEHDVDDAFINAPGHTAGEPGAFHIAELAHNPLHYFVDARVFAQDVLEVGEHGVGGVGTEIFFVAAGFGSEHAGLLEAVEFEADGVGGLAKLAFEVAQIGGGTAVQEELNQQAQTGFGGDECVEHQKNF